MTRDDAVRRVAALNRLADSTTFPEEAVQARRKVAFLTDRFKLDEPVSQVIPRVPPKVVPPVAWTVTATTTMFNVGTRIRVRFADGQIFEVSV